MTIRESLNILDTKAIDGEGKFLDLRNLYEAAKLDYDKKKKLKELIDRNEDAEVIAAYLESDGKDLNEAWSGVFSVNKLKNYFDLDKDLAKRLADYLYQNHYDDGFKSQDTCIDTYSNIILNKILPKLKQAKNNDSLDEDLDDVPDQGLQVSILGELFDADPSRWQQAVEDWGYDITPYATADEFLENVDTLELLNKFAELVKNNDGLNNSWYELFDFTNYDSNSIEENLKESVGNVDDWILMYLKNHPFDSADEMIEYVSEYEDIDALEDRFRTDVIGAIEDYFEDNLNESLNESVISFKDFLTGIEEATTEDEMLNILERFDTIPANYKISKEQYRTFMKAWRDKIKQIRQSNM